MLWQNVNTWRSDNSRSHTKHHRLALYTLAPYTHTYTVKPNARFIIPIFVLHKVIINVLTVLLCLSVGHSWRRPFIGDFIVVVLFHPTSNTLLWSKCERCTYNYMKTVTILWSLRFLFNMPSEQFHLFFLFKSAIFVPIFIVNRSFEIIFSSKCTTIKDHM